MTDARERRRQRAEENKGGMDAAGALKRLRVPLIIILLWGAGVAIAVTTSDASGDCPGHWHSTMNVFVEGERVLFTPGYTLENGRLPLKTHMHQGSESVWHFEPTKRECIEYRDALRRVEMDIGSGKLELSGDYHQQQGWGGVHRDNETHAVKAWMKEWEGDWESISLSKLDGMQVPDGAEVIVAYGAKNDTMPAAFEEQLTPYPSSSLAPQGDDGGGSGLPLGALFGLSGFALVALLVWRTFTKGTA